MRRTIMMALSAAGSLVLAACGSSADEAADANMTTSETNDGLANDLNDQASAASSTTPGFPEQMSGSDMFEIESGRLAEANGSSEAIRSMGAMLVKDHTKSSNELKAAATAAGIELPPPGMPADLTGKLNSLRAAPKGSEFDSLLLSQQVAVHQTALTALESEAAANTPFSAFAAKVRPVVQGHLDQLTKLQAGGN